MPTQKMFLISFVCVLCACCVCVVCVLCVCCVRVVCMLCACFVRVVCVVCVLFSCCVCGFEADQCVVLYRQSDKYRINYRNRPANTSIRLRLSGGKIK